MWVYIRCRLQANECNRTYWSVYIAILSRIHHQVECGWFRFCTLDLNRFRFWTANMQVCYRYNTVGESVPSLICLRFAMMSGVNWKYARPNTKYLSAPLSIHQFALQSRVKAMKSSAVIQHLVITHTTYNPRCGILFLPWKICTPSFQGQTMLLVWGSQNLSEALITADLRRGH